MCLVEYNMFFASLTFEINLRPNPEEFEPCFFNAGGIISQGIGVKFSES